MKAHEGTLRHMERMALARGEGELEHSENPVAMQYFIRRKYGESHRFYRVDPFAKIPSEVPKTGPPRVRFLDLTEWNEQREEFHKTERAAGCSARVFCPSCKVHKDEKVLMLYATESILSNAGNMPAKRQVHCPKCGRTGVMLL